MRKSNKGGRITISNSDENGSWYGWADIIAGKVIALGYESPREGGVFWTPTMLHNHKTLQGALNFLAEDWPELYARIVKETHNEKLKTRENVQRLALLEDIRSTTKKMKDVCDELKRLHKKREKLYKKL